MNCKDEFNNTFEEMLYKDRYVIDAGRVVCNGFVFYTISEEEKTMLEEKAKMIIEREMNKMSYKIGDRFVVEITDILTSDSGEKLYQMNQMRSCVFDDNGLGNLKKVKNKNTKFKVGDIVRVMDGGYKDCIGMIDEIDEDSYSVLTKINENEAMSILYRESSLEKVEV